LIRSRWLTFAPRWERLLVNAAMSAVAFILVAVFMFPEFATPAGWGWKLLAIAGLSLAIAASLELAQQQVLRSYAAALTGLTRAQRPHAVKAVRGGEIPSDPVVLASALRVGTVSQSYLDRASKSQKAARWWLPGLYLLIALLQFVDHSPRLGLFWLGFALYFAAYFGWMSHRARQLSRQVERLREAAVKVPQAAAALAETEHGVELPPRRIWPMVLMAVVIGLGFGIAGFTVGAPFKEYGHTPDCRAADDVVEFVNKHPEMLDSRLIVPGEPALHEYEEWSDQLESDAPQMSTGSVSGHVKRVAELSSEAVSVVRDLRKNPTGSPSPYAISAHQTAYKKTISDLVDETGKIVASCHPR
jgi:hypothetical protein